MRKKERYEKVIAWFQENVPVAETELHYLEGKIRTRSYSDQSGAMRYITEIYVDNMEMLTPKGF